MTTGTEPAPLAGITVVDLTHFVAGPWCTMMLADLGADVIKIEPPGGEIGRHMGAVYAGGESAIFLAFNRNKRGIVVDLKHPEGQAAVHRLVDHADVVVHNFRPRAAERIGMDAARLRARNPRLVHCSISAFGQDGPYAARPANDPITQALTGAMRLGRADGERPIRMGVSLPDFAAGVMAAVAITSALYRRRTTGAGCTVDLSLLDSELFAQLDHVQAELGPARTTRRGGEDPCGCSGVYRCRDGRYVHLDVPDAGQCPTDRILDSGEEPSAFAHDSGLVATAFALRDRAQWLDAFADTTATCVPVHELSEVFARRPAPLLCTEHPTAGEILLLRTPIRATPGWPDRVSPPPRRGEHTEEVLTDLGYSADAVAGLARSGVIGARPVARGHEK